LPGRPLVGGRAHLIHDWPMPPEPAVKTWDAASAGAASRRAGG
jgi:hypothetical protein